MKELFEGLEEKIELVEQYAYVPKVDAYGFVSVYSNLMNYIKDVWNEGGETSRKHLKKVFPRIVDRLAGVYERIETLKDKDYLVPNNHNPAGFDYMVDLLVQTTHEVRDLINPKKQMKKPAKSSSKKIRFRA